MNIPKSSIRRSIVSRYHSGLIATLDLNAADYRCIVSAVDDETLTTLYEDCDDFHTRTVEAVFGDGRCTDVRRRVIKNITYISMYGGQDRSGLSKKQYDALMSKLSFMGPIHSFRDTLYEASMAAGHVTTPGGIVIPLDGSEHKGKVLALYAQTCTNEAFMGGLINVHSFLEDKRSKELFTVHDELVIDVHPDEMQHLE